MHSCSPEPPGTIGLAGGGGGGGGCSLVIKHLTRDRKRVADWSPGRSGGIILTVSFILPMTGSTLPMTGLTLLTTVSNVSQVRFKSCPIC